MSKPIYQTVVTSPFIGKKKPVKIKIDDEDKIEVKK